MLTKLIKFKIKTTMKRSTILFIILTPFFLYFEIPFFMHISTFTFYQAVEMIYFDNISVSTLHDYAVGGVIYISFIYFMSSIFSPFIIQKSDIDFLYMLPVDEKEMIISQLISSFLIISLSMIFIIYIFSPIISISSMLVMLMISLLNTFSYFAFKKHRKIISTLITVWILSSILKFPFSPLSMVFGYTSGYFVLATLDILTLVLGVRNTNVNDLIGEFYKRQGLLMSNNKPTVSVELFSSSIFSAMLKRNFNFIELEGRMSVGGNIQLITKRIKFYKIFIISIISAIIYYIIFIFFIKNYLTQDIIMLLISYLIIMSISASSFISEPLWLNLSVMSPIEYARRYLLTKVLTVFVILLPLLISFILFNPVINIGSFLIPFSLIYPASIFARYYPSSQQLQTVQLSFKNMIVSYMATISLLPVYLDIFVPVTGLIITLIFSLPFLLLNRYWEETFEKAIINM